MHRGHATLRPAVVSAVSPLGYIPCDVANAYHLAGSGLNGAGLTIAIIDPYNDTTISSDLQAFDAQLGLPNPTFNVLQPDGTPSPLAGNWGDEVTLDVEWAHAIAPGATIDLVEAIDPSDLLNAVSYASHTLNPSVVSMSWGTSENGFGSAASELSTDQALFPPTNGAGNPITYVASAGDSGVGVAGPAASDVGANWPAVSTSVVSVGGTSLAPTAFGYSSVPGSHSNCSGTTSTPGVTSANETVWGNESCGTGCVEGTGGGPSAFVSKPGWQSAAPTATRGAPDVAMLADPFTGVATYEGGAWNNFTIGGTSLSAPMWAGVVAMLDQGRRAHSLSDLNQTSTSDWIYSTTSADFNDITGGSAPSAQLGCGPNNECLAQPGYDLVTGRGSPLFANLATDLAATGTSATKGTLTTVSPTRIMDTRTGTGGLSGPMQPNQTFNLTISQIPSSAVAIVVNVGVTDTTNSGYLLVYPCGQPRPFASTANFQPGQSIANLTQVAVSSQCLSVYLNMAGNTGTSDVFLDLQGYYGSSVAGSTGLYNPLNTPYRALDTRTSLGGHPTPFGPGEGWPLQVAGNSTITSSPGIPADAAAVTLNLTAVQGSVGTYLSVYPAVAGSTPCPADLTSSNLNVSAGVNQANRVTVKVGDSGRICFYNSLGTVHVLADLAGWYSGGGAGDTTGLAFSAWSPLRYYDSRLVGQQLGTGGGSCPGANFLLPIPPAAAGVSYNLTGLNASQPTYLEAFPSGAPPSPPTSDINYVPGTVQPNLVVTKVGTGSSITICNSAGSTDFFVDVNGVYRS